MSAAEKRLPGLLSNEWAWLGLALALRAGFALWLGDGYYQTDEGGYVGGARQFAATGLFGAGGQAFSGPPIPMAFFGTFLRFSERLLWPRLGQAVVGTAAAWLIGRMTLSLTGSRRAGLAALAIACVYPFFIYYGGVLMSETFYVALSAAGLWALCASLADRGASLRTASAAGLLLAAAALCRAECAPITAVLWLAGSAACLTRRWRWKALLTGAACWLLLLGLWCARNKAVGGRFSLDDHGGMALIHGTVLFDSNEIDTGVAMREFGETDLYRQAMALDPVSRDRFYIKTGLEYMKAHPGRTLRQWGRKAVNFWRFYPRLDKRYADSPSNNPNAGFGRLTLAGVSLLVEPVLILGGLAGLWGLRRRWETLLPLALFLLGTMGLHIIVVSQMRYRLPVMPVLILGLASLLAGSGPGDDVRARRP